MKRAWKVLFFLPVLCIIALPALYIQYKQQRQQHVTAIATAMPTHAPTPAPPTPTPIPTPSVIDTSSPHILGGFSIDSSESASNAAADGIQVAFEYGQPPSANSNLGQTFQTLGMKMIDGKIWGYLYEYECHRTLTVALPPPGSAPYCQSDSASYPATEDELLADVAAHLQQVKDNPLIAGYWALDDWVSWDAGSARPLLAKIHDLVQRYTPGRPVICGFGGTIWINQKYGWNDWVAENFTPQGCDEVALYIYASTSASTTQAPRADAVNWSMIGLLPAIFASLQQRGWNIKQTPLIGVGQAFGGAVAGTNHYRVVPDALDIEIQSKSFCEHGASGLVFYAWDDSSFGPDTQMPANSADIETGIRNGIAACKQYWSNPPA
jgi:hypothetical protein